MCNPGKAVSSLSVQWAIAASDRGALCGMECIHRMFDGFALWVRPVDFLVHPSVAVRLGLLYYQPSWSLV